MKLSDRYLQWIKPWLTSILKYLQRDPDVTYEEYKKVAKIVEGAYK